MDCFHQRQVDLDGKRKLPCAWPGCPEGNAGGPRLYTFTHRSPRASLWAPDAGPLPLTMPVIEQHAWQREVMEHQPPGRILPWEEPRRWYFWRLLP